MADRPSVLFFHVDNLGFGELSCYSGSPFRGVGSAGGPRQRPIRVRVQGPGRGGGTAGEAVQ